MTAFYDRYPHVVFTYVRMRPLFYPLTMVDGLAAVDLALDKLALQIRRYKEKIQDHRRTPSTGEVAGAPTVEEPGEE